MNKNGNDVLEPGLLALLYMRRPQSLSLSDTAIKIGKANFSIVKVAKVSVGAAWFAPRLLGGVALRISVKESGKFVHFNFILFEDEASSILNQITAATRRQLKELLNRADDYAHSVTERLELIFQPHVYVRSSISLGFSEAEMEDYNKFVSRLKIILQHPLRDVALLNNVSSTLKTLLSIEDYIRAPQIARERHNQAYALYWKEKEAEYFKNVEDNDLTDEQIHAALVFDDATLVVAAAGSGKSSCIVGKIGFALKVGLFDESQILALAYNKKAAESLQERLEKKLQKALGRPVSVASKTFHSFGRATLVAHHGEEFAAKVLKEDKGEEKRFIKSVITNLTKEDPAFLNKLTSWVSLAPYDEPQLVGSSGDLEECAKRYEECCRERLRARIASGKKPWEPTIPTWRQDRYVRSLEERSIANWLILHDVEFEYERTDWEGAERLGLGKYQSGKPKPYKPDFTYFIRENLSNGQTRAVRVVHEHFALDDNGHAPEWLGGATYEQYAKGKRAMYRAWMGEQPTWRERVVFIETTSAMIRDGSIWDHLEVSLRAAGVTVHATNRAIQDCALEQFRNAGDLEKEIINFVLLFKDSGLDEKSIRENAANSDNPYRSKLFLDVAFSVFDAYQQALKNSGLIDYADMLRESIALLSQEQTESPYRLILVDEFQDISRLKAELVKAVLAKCPLESILFCVGDDWQTINRFSGSDVSIFTNTSQYFGRPTTRLELTNTFRCSQGIADVAKHLVMLNSGQFNKDVKAHSDKVKGAVRVVHHGDNAIERQATLRAELDNIISIARSLEITHPTVQILRRTKNDTTVPEGLNSEFLTELVVEYKGKLVIELYTMHGSKGLEANFVIIPGLDSGFRGFPDERPAEPMLDFVRPVLHDPIEEERRLFYVALTRAKVMVSLLVAGRRPSEFIVELESVRHDFPAINWIPWTGEARVICPKCKKGSLVAKRGSSSTSFCTRAVQCGFTSKIDKNSP